MKMALGKALMLMFLIVVVCAEEEEEEEKPTPTAVAVAATLIGAISFQMSLFYLTNHKDPDMRRYSYEIINSTVSIFSAVLLFQTANDLVGYFIAREKWYVDFAHMFVWYTILQLVLAWISGAISIKWEPPKEDDPNYDTELDKMVLQMKSYAVLLAHLTGFASINAWGSLQQLEFFKTPFMSFLVVPISATGQFCLQRITNYIRHKVSEGDDGETDEFEEKWDEETEECENDVMGLTLSFNLMQACRFLITSDLPNQEGEVSNAKLLAHGGNMQVLELYGVAFISIIAMTCLFLRKEAEELEEAGEGKEEEKKEWSFFEGVAERAEDALLLTLSMTFAWGVFFCTRMFLTRISLFRDGMLRAVCLTMILSFVSFSCIRGLDMMSDSAENDPKLASLKDAIKQIIKAIGILVGFGWEQTFDQAVVSLSSAMPDPHTAKLLLGLFCVAIVVPAWKWYLLPMAIKNGWEFGFVIDPDIPQEQVERIKSHIDTKKSDLQKKQKDLTQSTSQMTQYTEPLLGDDKQTPPPAQSEKESIELEIETLKNANASLLADIDKMRDKGIATTSPLRTVVLNEKDKEAATPSPSRESGLLTQLEQKFAASPQPRRRNHDAPSLKEQVEALESLTNTLFQTNILRKPVPGEQV